MDDSFVMQILKTYHNWGSEEFYTRRDDTSLFLGEDRIFYKVKA